MKVASLVATVTFVLLAGCQQAPPAGDNATASAGQPPTRQTLPTPLAAAAGGADLSGFVGRYPFDGAKGARFVDQPAVISAVDKLVPDKAVAARILSVDATMTPIAKRDGALIAFGCEQHNCGSHNWAISLKPDGTRPRICYKPDGESPRWYGDQPVGAAKDSCPSGDTGGPA